MDKSTLRKTLLTKRAALGDTQQSVLSERIHQQILAHPVFQHSQRIACYLDIGGEVKTQALIDSIWQLNKTCYIPVIDTDTESLRLGEFTQQTDCQKSACGVLEPINTTFISFDDCDLVLVPLAGFDKQHYRLGMGGGHYDRTFAACKNKPYAIGLGFACQYVETLPTEWFDIPMDEIISA